MLKGSTVTALIGEKGIEAPLFIGDVLYHRIEHTLIARSADKAYECSHTYLVLAAYL